MRAAARTLAAVAIFAAVYYLLGLGVVNDQGTAIRSATLGTTLARIGIMPSGLVLEGLRLDGRDATPLITVVLAGVTAWLAFETQRLARGSSREVGVLERQASTAEGQLKEFRAQSRHRPALIWEQAGLEHKWEEGAEIGPKVGKRIHFDVVLRAQNLGGTAHMDSARIRSGVGTISYEIPLKRIPPNREYMLKIGFDAIGGTRFRYQTIAEQAYRSWDTDEKFVDCVLVALGSDWFDTNDPQPLVMPLDRPDQVDTDAGAWAETHFQNYDAFRAASSGQ